MSRVKEGGPERSTGDREPVGAKTSTHEPIKEPTGKKGKRAAYLEGKAWGKQAK